MSTDQREIDALGAQVSETQVHAFAIERLAHAFETSARRWELIVYPAGLAFTILAAYGFYLIFSLSRDIHYMAISVDTNLTVMASNIQTMSNDMAQMNRDIQTMEGSVDSMARDVSTMNPMLSSLQNMDRSVQNMTLSTVSMSRDVGVMNNSISRPASFMNWFMPW